MKNKRVFWFILSALFNTVTAVVGLVAFLIAVNP